MLMDFRLPDLGEGLTESEIVNWHVGVGDTVTLNQVIAEVETAKAIVELPSPYAGIVARLYAEPGVTVNVGEPIVAFEVEASAGLVGSRATDAAPDAASRGTAEAPAPNLVGYGARVESGVPQRRARRAGSEAPMVQTAPAPAPDPASAPVEAPVEPPVPAPAASEPTPPEASAAPVDRPRSTPPVRKLAHDLGIDLAQLAGTGDHGIITREDVEAAASAMPSGVGKVPDRPTPEPSSGAASGAVRETRTPIRSVRKHTAAAMVQSAFTAPHVTEFLTVDVTATMELLARLKQDRALAEHRIGILAIVAKALCIAIRRNPSVNTHWDDAAQEIVEFHYVNLGIAAATPRGLVVPNIQDAGDLTLPELADALAALTATARDGRTEPARLSGGTISITNIGVFGIDAGTPILNPGEAAILAMGAVRREPREHEGGIALREVMTLSLSFDHRLVDGEQGSRFLADIGMMLRDPARAFAMV
ncbi:dihydrolipoamide acetyltransferase family protein [Leifsonia sp. YIM 134122]|uniref:Dihydrolipoamide acetyltransferase component of pyruvate dehydrogenase complex n=1 Tax=Leifsonia stereocauli TaxID=3134136 RepID=A0ABU9W2T2_9MICO